MVTQLNKIRYGSLAAVLILVSACGSSGDDNGNYSTVSSSEVSQSSSSASQESAQVALIFPGSYAQLGFIASTELVVIIDRDDIQSVTLDGVAFYSAGDKVWRSSEPVELDLSESEIEFSLELLADSGERVSANSLFIKNSFQLGAAGKSPRQDAADSLIFSLDGNSLFFTEPSYARVATMNLVTGDTSILYESSKTVDNIGYSWPLALMRDGELVWTEPQSMYEFGSTLVELQVLPSGASMPESVMLSADSLAPMNLIIDSDGSHPFSSGEQHGYILDEDSEQAIKRVALTGDKAGNISNLTAIYGEDASFLPEGDRAGIVRQGSSDEILGFINDPSPSLIRFITTETAFGTDTETQLITELKDPDSERIGSVDAVVASPLAENVFYIADAKRIWKLDVSLGQADLTLVSSSNIDDIKGTGPDLRAGTSTIVHHPKAEVLYLSRGSFGVMTVDIASGDRAALLD